MSEIEQTYGMPWLVFKLKSQHFAINSETVETIFLLEQPAVKMPEYPESVRGIINLRGQIVPLIDLRQILGMQAFDYEQEQFAAMLEQRKQDHINWVTELKRCIDEDEEFKLATDPHKCAFGKWYDNYKTDNQVITFHLRKIDEPHVSLHKVAHEAFECKRLCEECKREQCLKESLELASDVYMPTVVGLLEEAKEIFKEAHREMCVVVRQNTELMGLLVDEVVAVEQLATLPSNEALDHMFKSRFVTDVAQDMEQGDRQILILDKNSLFQEVWNKN